MPLPINQKKVAAIEYVIKRMKGSDDYNRMKESNEYGNEKMMERKKPEEDYRAGMIQASETLLEAISSNNVARFQESLTNLVEMIMSQKQEDEELEKEE